MGIPALRTDPRRERREAAIARFFTSRGRARLSHDDALMVQQILAAAVGVDRNHWAYRDGIVGPRTRALLHRATAEQGENGLRELQRRLRAAGLYTGEIDGVLGPLTLSALTAAHVGPEADRRRILEGQPPPAPPPPAALDAEEFERRVSRVLQYDARGEDVPADILAGLSEAQRDELDRRRTAAREEARLFNEEHGHVPFGPEVRAEEERQLRARREAEERRLAEARAALDAYGSELDAELDAPRDAPLPTRLASGPDAEARQRAWADLRERLRGLGYPASSDTEIQQSYLRSRFGAAADGITSAGLGPAFDGEFTRYVSDARTSMPMYGPDGQRLGLPPLATAVISPSLAVAPPAPQADPEAARRLSDAEAELGGRRPTVEVSDDGQTVTIGRVTMPLEALRRLAQPGGFGAMMQALAGDSPENWASVLSDAPHDLLPDENALDAFPRAVQAFRARVLGTPPANLDPPLSREQLVRHGLGALLGIDPANHALLQTTLQEAERARLVRLEREAQALAAAHEAPTGADRQGPLFVRTIPITGGARTDPATARVPGEGEAEAPSVVPVLAVRPVRVGTPPLVRPPGHLDEARLAELRAMDARESAFRDVQLRAWRNTALRDEQARRAREERDRQTLIDNQPETPEETARILAGLPPRSGTPVAAPVIPAPPVPGALVTFEGGHPFQFPATPAGRRARQVFFRTRDRDRYSDHRVAIIPRGPIATDNPDQPPTMVIYLHGWRHTASDDWRRMLARQLELSGIPNAVLAAPQLGVGVEDSTVGALATPDGIRRFIEEVARRTAEQQAPGDAAGQERIRQALLSGRIILAGHSGGGAGVNAIIANAPPEIRRRIAGLGYLHGLYGGADRVARFVTENPHVAVHSLYYPGRTETQSDRLEDALWDSPGRDRRVFTEVAGSEHDRLPSTSLGTVLGHLYRTGSMPPSVASAPPAPLPGLRPPMGLGAALSAPPSAGALTAAQMLWLARLSEAPRGPEGARIPVGLSAGHNWRQYRHVVPPTTPGARPTVTGGYVRAESQRPIRVHRSFFDFLGGSDGPHNYQRIFFGSTAAPPDRTGVSDIAVTVGERPTNYALFAIIREMYQIGGYQVWGQGEGGQGAGFQTEDRTGRSIDVSHIAAQLTGAGAGQRPRLWTSLHVDYSEGNPTGSTIVPYEPRGRGADPRPGEALAAMIRALGRQGNRHGRLGAVVWERGLGIGILLRRHGIPLNLLEVGFSTEHQNMLGKSLADSANPLHIAALAVSAYTDMRLIPGMTQAQAIANARVRLAAVLARHRIPITDPAMIAAARAAQQAGAIASPPAPPAPPPGQPRAEVLPPAGAGAGAVRVGYAELVPPPLGPAPAPVAGPGSPGARPQSPAAEPPPPPAAVAATPALTPPAA